MADVIEAAHGFLYEQLRILWKANAAPHKAQETLRESFDDWTFDRGLFLLKLTVGQRLRSAEAVVADYQNQSEITISVSC